AGGVLKIAVHIRRDTKLAIAPALTGCRPTETAIMAAEAMAMDLTAVMAGTDARRMAAARRRRSATRTDSMTASAIARLVTAIGPPRAATTSTRIAATIRATAAKICTSRSTGRPTARPISAVTTAAELLS